MEHQKIPRYFSYSEIEKDTTSLFYHNHSSDGKLYINEELLKVTAKDFLVFAKELDKELYNKKTV